MSTEDDRYERVSFRGVTVNKWTRAALLECEHRLGYELTLLQGSYHQGVSASAGTHDGGGVIDLAPYDADNKIRVLRQVGFAAWHRVPSQGPWEEHIHAVLIGDMDAAPLARQQVTAYRAGRNGLANNGPDDGPNVGEHYFHYPPIKPLPVDQQAAKNIENGTPVANVKRARVAQRMIQIIKRLRAGKEA